jgi:hypothetical protein
MPSKTRESDVASWPQIWSFWPYFLGAQAAYNSKVHDALFALSNEWQTFVQQRLTEDTHVVQAASRSRTPEETMTITLRFWQKAAEDYARQYAAFAKIAGDCMVSAAKEAAQTRAEATRLQKAA